MQSATPSWSCRFPHRLILPTRSFITHQHLIFFCHLLYRQSLPIRLCERYSESQLIRSRIWLCFIPYELHVKLTSTLGWLFGAWRTLALGFQCVNFCVNKRDCDQRLSRRGGASSSGGNRMEAEHWNALWKLECPGKVKHFLWCMAHNSLAVRMELWRRGIDLDTKCVVCNKQDEDGSHLFFKCSCVKKVWQALNMDTYRTHS